jgi:hypothetical protein
MIGGPPRGNGDQLPRYVPAVAAALASPLVIKEQQVARIVDVPAASTMAWRAGASERVAASCGG